MWRLTNLRLVFLPMRVGSRVKMWEKSHSGILDSTSFSRTRAVIGLACTRFGWHRLKLELAGKLPSLHDLPPAPSKHLTRCLRNRVQAKQRCSQLSKRQVTIQLVADERAKQLWTRNAHFAVRPAPKVSDGEAFKEGICLNYFFSLGSTRCVGSRHNEGGVGILHCWQDCHSSRAPSKVSQI